MNIAINGFGRIGRGTLKAILSQKLKMNIVAINDLAPTDNLAYLLKYDTAYGRYNKKVDINTYEKKVGKVKTTGELVIGNKKILTFAQRDPADLPWRALKIDVVLECTGRFRTEELASLHIKAGAKRVIISAPSKGGAVKPFIIGVNEDDYTKSKIIDNASCTTNCIAPVIAVLNNAFGVKKSLMTTIHAYTADQGIQDASHKDKRRGRSACLNIVPTTTGSAIATTKLIPELEGKFDGISVRVPIITGSLSDFTLLLSKKVTVEDVNNVLVKASKQKRFKGILAVTHEPLVSSDIIGQSYSSIVDLEFTRVVDGDLVKILAWYDNEWGYSNRLAEIAYTVGLTL